jgi:hypothetical protein
MAGGQFLVSTKWTLDVIILVIASTDFIVIECYVHRIMPRGSSIYFVIGCQSSLDGLTSFVIAIVTECFVWIFLSSDGPLLYYNFAYWIYHCMEMDYIILICWTITLIVCRIMDYNICVLLIGQTSYELYNKQWRKVVLILSTEDAN